MGETKLCRICSNPKIGSHSTYCKDCYNSYKRNNYLKHRSKEIKRSQDYNEKNKEKFTETLKKYRKGDSYKKSRAEWISKNKDKRNFYDRQKRFKRRAAINGFKILPEQWISLLSKHNNKCFWCRKKFDKLEMDHYIPLAKGGAHHIDNIVPACKPCNCSKRDQDPIEFANKIGRIL